MSADRSEQLVLLKRLLIIFGSICSAWCIIGLIFLTIQTYRYLKERISRKVFLYEPSFQLPIQQTLKQDRTSENEDEDNDDQASVSTSVSFISERSKTILGSTRYPISRQGIPEEPLELIFSNTIGISNLAYSRSTLSSSSDNDTSLLYYPGYRNFAYSQSTLCSSDSHFHEKTHTPSLDIPLHPSSSALRPLNAKRPASRSSSNTTSSQITTATYVSTRSTTKSIALPTVMITDVDRLQTDIIELEDFEPEKEYNRARSQLRFLLNDRLPPTSK